MPYLEKNQHSPELPKNISKEPAPKDTTVFHGRSQVSAYELRNLLERDTKTRGDLAKELHTSNLYSEKMDHAIKGIEEQMPKSGFITESSARKIVEQAHHHEMQKGADGAVREKTGGFLKKFFGIK